MKKNNDDFTIPKDFNEEQRKVAQIIIAEAQKVFGPGASGLGCPAFYTPEEWRERGEKYHWDSLFIVCHDGGNLSQLFSLDYEAYELIEKMRSTLEKAGYYSEQGTIWNSGIYHT